MAFCVIRSIFYPHCLCLWKDSKCSRLYVWVTGPMGNWNKILKWFLNRKRIRNVFEGLVKQEQHILIGIWFKTTSKWDLYAWRICQTNKTWIFFLGNKNCLKIANIWKRRASDARFVFAAENKQFIWPQNEMLQQTQRRTRKALNCGKRTISRGKGFKKSKSQCMLCLEESKNKTNRVGPRRCSLNQVKCRYLWAVHLMAASPQHTGEKESYPVSTANCIPNESKPCIDQAID